MNEKANCLEEPQPDNNFPSSSSLRLRRCASLICPNSSRLMPVALCLRVFVFVSLCLCGELFTYGSTDGRHHEAAKERNRESPGNSPFALPATARLAFVFSLFRVFVVGFGMRTATVERQARGA